MKLVDRCLELRIFCNIILEYLLVLSLYGYREVSGLCVPVSLRFRSVKEMCRKISNCGIEYGLLFDENPNNLIDIYFNYFGKMTERDSDNEEYYTGNDISSLNKLISKIVITCQVINDCMNIGITYDKEFYSTKTINMFKELCYTNIRKIVDDLSQTNETHKTASDYDSIDLSMNELSEIEDMFS